MVILFLYHTNKQQKKTTINSQFKKATEVKVKNDTLVIIN